jgi:hypothetical protein
LYRERIRRHAVERPLGRPFVETREPATHTLRIEAFGGDPNNVMIFGVGIARWSAPVILGVRALAMPLACGNAVVFKASEDGSDRVFCKIAVGLMRRDYQLYPISLMNEYKHIIFNPMVDGAFEAILAGIEPLWSLCSIRVMEDR